MTWNEGTATDYIDLLDQLIEVVTSRHMATIAINAAGTGYVAGDLLGITNTGSTNTHVARIEVLTVGGGGEILTARIYAGGAYTVDPTTTVGNAATGGTGSGATFNLTFDDTGWTLTRRTKVAASATVGAGGTGYSVADVLTLVGGVLGNGGSAATFAVATLSGSAVATVTLVSPGQYEVPPTNAVLTSVSPSGGTGATLNVTYTDKTGDTVVVLEGDAGGSMADPVVVLKTYQGLDQSGINTTYNWAAFMATAASQALAVHQMVGISPGFNTSLNNGAISATATGDGAFVPLKTSDAFNITWWMSVTGRRIHMIAKVQSATTTYYSELSIGLLNQFGITSEMPYPAYVLGASDRPLVWYRDTNSLFGGISDVISRNNGPGFFWSPEGSWLSFRNSTISGNTVLSPDYGNAGSAAPRAVLWPLGYGSVHELAEDAVWDTAPTGGFDNADFTNATPTLIYRTPDTGGDLFPPFPLTVQQHDNQTDFYRVLGEIDGCFWFSTAGAAINSEDRFAQSGAYYRVFQSGTRIEPYSFFCVRED